MPLGSAFVNDLFGGFTDQEKLNIHSVVRLFGQIMWRGTAGNNFILARLGIGTISNDAMAAAVTPDAFDDEEFGWYTNQALLWDEPSITYKDRDIDVRTSRLIKPDTTLFLSVENSSSSSGSLEIATSFRMLLAMT